MDDGQLLDICLNVTGAFEGGTPSYSTLTGDSDGQGLSAGILQWNAGQGTLQLLVRQIVQAMGSDRAAAYFMDSDIQAFMQMEVTAALAFVRQHYINPHSRQVTPSAEMQWKAFLNSQESIDAQRDYASTTVLSLAHSLANKYVAEAAASTRVLAFFFDLCTQQGGMKTVPVLSGKPNYFGAMDFAVRSNLACADLWEPVVTVDPLAAKLVYYGYERAKLADPHYLWDTFSRRGTIACRIGIVHGVKVDLTAVLD